MRDNTMEKRIFFLTGQARQSRRSLAKNRDNLNRSAYAIVKLYQAGSLPDVNTHQGWPLMWKDLNKILRNRCPGFSDLEYGIALNMGFDHPKEDPSP